MAVAAESLRPNFPDRPNCHCCRCKGCHCRWHRDRRAERRQAVRFRPRPPRAVAAAAAGSLRPNFPDRPNCRCCRCTRCRCPWHRDRRAGRRRAVRSRFRGPRAARRRAADRDRSGGRHSPGGHCRCRRLHRSADRHRPEDLHRSRTCIARRTRIGGRAPVSGRPCVAWRPRVRRSAFVIVLRRSGIRGRPGVRRRTVALPACRIVARAQDNRAALDVRVLGRRRRGRRDEKLLGIDARWQGWPKRHDQRRGARSVLRSMLFRFAARDRGRRLDADVERAALNRQRSW